MTKNVMMMCGSLLSVLQASSIMDRRKVYLIPQLPKKDNFPKKDNNFSAKEL
jgi:hypothetical protein